MPTSQMWSYMESHIGIKYDAVVPNMVLHVITYIDANVPNMVLHENTYR
ncbi:hypothetical protein F383_16612 [Gossypium arboreum]|uniref:Uncharacterized protein n=1 Tax=Gossypium arboreum TaxID=29729 RepID=A0A0B0NRE1_GOSAR|nr:hypothetical protein F383_16612 [Gossypium arboreum]